MPRRLSRRWAKEHNVNIWGKPLSVVPTKIRTIQPKPISKPKPQPVVKIQQQLKPIRIKTKPRPCSKPISIHKPKAKPRPSIRAPVIKSMPAYKTKSSISLREEYGARKKIVPHAIFKTEATHPKTIKTHTEPHLKPTPKSVKDTYRDYATKSKLRTSGRIHSAFKSKYYVKGGDKHTLKKPYTRKKDYIYREFLETTNDSYQEIQGVKNGKFVLSSKRYTIQSIQPFISDIVSADKYGIIAVHTKAGMTYYTYTHGRTKTGGYYTGKTSTYSWFKQQTKIINPRKLALIAFEGFMKDIRISPHSTIMEKHERIKKRR